MDKFETAEVEPDRTAKPASAEEEEFFCKICEDAIGGCRNCGFGREKKRAESKKILI